MVTLPLLIMERVRFSSLKLNLIVPNLFYWIQYGFLASQEQKRSGEPWCVDEGSRRRLTTKRRDLRRLVTEKEARSTTRGRRSRQRSSMEARERGATSQRSWRCLAEER